LEKPIKIGGDAGELVEVLDGLAPGDKVVTNGSFDLRSKALRESGGAI
jgi:multidrug efflux pump subunit AcrA (membrane-fusion protein)